MRDSSLFLRPALGRSRAALVFCGLSWSHHDVPLAKSKGAEKVSVIRGMISGFFRLVEQIFYFYFFVLYN